MADWNKISSQFSAFKLIVGTLQVYLLDTYLEIDAEFYNFSKTFRKQQLVC